MTSPQPLAKNQHFNYLDSARGIAALMVLFYHYINWKYDNITGIKIASIIANGSDAVSFFFVLSGFVLSYKYVVLQHPLDIRKFYITRYFRLFPAFAFTVLLNVLYWNRHDLSKQALLDIFIYNKQQFYEEILLFRLHNKFFLAGWTLSVELIASFFMPFAIAMARYNRKLIPYLIIPFLFIEYPLGKLFIHFMLGLIVSCYYLDIQGEASKATKWFRYRYFFIFIAIILFSIRHIERIFPFGHAYQTIAGYLSIDLFYYTGLASFIFLVAMINSVKTQRILEHSVLRYFGKISYGVYLSHWVIVQAIFDHWEKLTALFPDNKTAFFVMMGVCFILTTLLAIFIHYVIELPFIRFGKKVSKRLKPSLIIG